MNYLKSEQAMLQYLRSLVKWEMPICYLKVI